MRLLHIVYTHFQTYFKGDRPLLLALSGGPDSMALFHLLQEIAHDFPFELHLAHVDHGWREESAQEARLLQEWTAGIPFHLKRLDELSPNASNLEAKARECRLAFFRELQGRYNYQAILLAHHADDVAETVLKRFFEGVGFTRLSPMKEESTLHGLLLWRPLLSVPKSTLIAYLHKKKIPYFKDKTNLNPRFLRGRLRRSLIPFLEGQFGKQVSKNLVRQATRAKELQEFLDQRIASMWAATTEDSVPLSLFAGYHPVEVRHFLKAWAPELSHEGLTRLTRITLGREVGKRVSMGQKVIVCEKEALKIISSIWYPEGIASLVANPS